MTSRKKKAPGMVEITAEQWERYGGATHDPGPVERSRLPELLNDRELAQPIGLSEPLQSQAADYLETLTPEQMKKRRREHVLKEVDKALTMLMDEITEELTTSPETPRFIVQTTNMPEDVLWVVVNSLVRAGWNVRVDEGRMIVIELPVIEQLCRPLGARPSRVEAL